MPKITLILHNIRSAHNVGSIFRTAEGFGVNNIVISGYTPYPTLEDDSRLPHESNKITRQIHKTALGTEKLVPFSHYEHLEDWLAVNNELMPVYALEQSPDSIIIRNFTPPATFALLLGEEVHGIEQQFLNQCDGIIEIPMVGQKESFNVSVATGIALFALTS